MSSSACSKDDPRRQLAAGNGATGLADRSLEHQECEIKEELFTPDIQQVERVRLAAIYHSRTLLRDRELGEEGVANGNLFHGQLPMETRPSLESHPHDYINQDMVDMCLSLEKEPPNNVLVESVGKRVLSSNGYTNLGNPAIRSGAPRQHPVAYSDGNDLDEFEKRLLLTKNKAMMPNIYKIPWYHPGISRHIAESLLVSKDVQDGTYLLRDCVSEVDIVTLSVRCQDSVKHYKIPWDGKQFLFGLGKFPNLEAFTNHFSHQPVISGMSGVLVQLRFPYPRGVSEPAIYLEANVITNLDSNLSNLKPSSNKPQKFTSSLDLSVNSKEGYLTKLGYHRKNWKKRWFVLYRNELKYFNSSTDKSPLKTINLEDVTRVDRDDTTGKPNCLRLVTCYRTFFMYASSEVEANEWVQILDWRLKQQFKVT